MTNELRLQDSNLYYNIQNVVCYHYTKSHCTDNYLLGMSATYLPKFLQSFASYTHYRLLSSTICSRLEAYNRSMSQLRIANCQLPRHHFLSDKKVPSHHTIPIVLLGKV